MPAAEDPVRVRLQQIDTDHLTPMQALTLLAELKREVSG
jgi:hypothetical protein